MPDIRNDIVVIGGGIVGLSTAMHLMRHSAGLRLTVVEKEGRVAAHQTGHNSGVIHSGIYYQPGSMKAKLCVEGAAAMVAFCKEHNLPHAVCGKVIVATNQEEIPRLEMLFERGHINGLTGLRLLNADQLHEIEPHCAGLRAIHVPSTGITDYALVAEKYAELTMAAGGSILTAAKVTGLRRMVSETIIETTRGPIATRYVINCAGLHSDHIGKMAGEHSIPMVIPFRGEYYDLVPAKHSLVKALIYPVPNPQFPFLGVHFTRRIHGGVDAGPNAVFAFKREGYRWSNFSFRDTLEAISYSGFRRMARKHWRHGLGEMHRSLSKPAFVRTLQHLIPEIREADLTRDGSGVRAQTVLPDGSMADDFQFSASNNMLHLYNVPSPAATASLPIGRTIAQMAQENFGLAP